MVTLHFPSDKSSQTNRATHNFPSNQKKQFFFGQTDPVLVYYHFSPFIFMFESI